MESVTGMETQPLILGSIPQPPVYGLPQHTLHFWSPSQTLQKNPKLLLLAAVVIIPMTYSPEARPR